MRKKTTQKQLALYKLIQCHKENPLRFVPAWEFGGEIFVKATGKWELMSYKCPARLSDIILENPNIVERETITGRSGATYFGYRLSGEINPKDIVDPHLRDFYNFIVLNEPEVPRQSKVETKNEVVSVGQFDFNFKPTVEQ